MRFRVTRGVTIEATCSRATLSADATILVGTPPFVPGWKAFDPGGQHFSQWPLLLYVE